MINSSVTRVELLNFTVVFFSRNKISNSPSLAAFSFSLLAQHARLLDQTGYEYPMISLKFQSLAPVHLRQLKRPSLSTLLLISVITSLLFTGAISPTVEASEFFWLKICLRHLEFFLGPFQILSLQRFLLVINNPIIPADDWKKFTLLTTQRIFPPDFRVR